MSQMTRFTSSFRSHSHSVRGVRKFLLWTCVTAFALGSVVAVYLAKSALGINLFVSRSPLHELLYHFVK